VALDHFAFKVLNRALGVPPMLLPSGMKLTVTSSGCGQAAPVVA
jgi:hypothetical protein